MSVGERETDTVDGEERAAIERLLARWGAHGAVGSIRRLSGLTNRTFLVGAGEMSVAVRLPGAGTDVYIDRDAELHNARIAAGLGIGPEVLHAADGALVMAFLDGNALSPEDLREQPHTVVAAGRLLRRVHDSPAPFAGRFDALAVIAAHHSALTHSPDGVDRLIARVAPLEPPPRLVPCHNDPWPENFIGGDNRLHLLDWEYSAMGDPAWDLADLIVESRLDEDGAERLLTAYTSGPVDPALRARVAAMGPVTDLLWGLWALVQDQDGNRAMDYEAYGHRRLRRAARSLA